MDLQDDDLNAASTEAATTAAAAAAGGGGGGVGVGEGMDAALMGGPAVLASATLGAPTLGNNT